MADQLDEDDYMRFGKYKDHKISAIMADDPGYLLWAYENVDHFDLTPLTLQRLERAVEAKQERSDDRRRWR